MAVISGVVAYFVGALAWFVFLLLAKPKPRGSGFEPLGFILVEGLLAFAAGAFLSGFVTALIARRHAILHMLCVTAILLVVNWGLGLIGRGHNPFLSLVLLPCGIAAALGGGIAVLILNYRSWKDA